MTNLFYRIFDDSTSLLQGSIFVYFAFRFLGSKRSKRILHLSCVLAVVALFLSISVQNSIMLLSAAEPVFYLMIMLPFCFIALDGKWYSKILIPLLIYIIYGGLTIGLHFLFTAVLSIDGNTLMNTNSIYKIIIVMIINVFYVFIMNIVSNVYNNEIFFSGVEDFFITVVTPIICLMVIFMTLYISTNSKLTDKAKVALSIIDCSMLFISIIMVHMMERISKNNMITMQNNIMKKEQELYKTQILGANKYINTISSMKHDMKNKLLCIDEMILNSNLEEARELCRETSIAITSTPKCISTDNIYLNSILNVISNKAAEDGIDVKIKIEEGLLKIDGTDIITIIGNLSDNAIEYLANHKDEYRALSISIFKKNSYSMIVVKNTIFESVLESNPHLQSNKLDKHNHGFGVKSVKKSVEKYGGTIDFSEWNDMFIATIMFELAS
ncbi:MAG: GHKL domain-containing protein [Acutalibacteraceae bacterium]|nr:GHKL domain-containing protein [Acutalibacteraceae bacterium]